MRRQKREIRLRRGLSRAGERGADFADGMLSIELDRVDSLDRTRTRVALEEAAMAAEARDRQMQTRGPCEALETVPRNDWIVEPGDDGGGHFEPRQASVGDRVPVQVIIQARKLGKAQNQFRCHTP